MRIVNDENAIIYDMRREKIDSLLKKFKRASDKDALNVNQYIILCGWFTQKIALVQFFQDSSDICSVFCYSKKYDSIIMKWAEENECQVFYRKGYVV